MKGARCTIRPVIFSCDSGIRPKQGIEALALNDKAIQIRYQHLVPSGPRICCKVADWTVSCKPIKNSLSNEAMSYSALSSAAVSHGLFGAQLLVSCNTTH